MLTRTCYLLVLAGLLAGTLGCPSAEKPAPATAPSIVGNPTIADAVQKYLGRKTITREDLLAVKELNLNGTGLSEISDLAELKNLEKLELNGNCLTDLSPLANLTKLRRLSASNDPFLSAARKARLNGRNTFKDLSALERLEGLTHLDLTYTDISSIEFVRKLPNLEHASLFCNPISDIRPIGALKKLKRVYFYQCMISDTASSGSFPILRASRSTRTRSRTWLPWRAAWD